MFRQEGTWPARWWNELYIKPVREKEASLLKAASARLFALKLPMMRCLSCDGGEGKWP